MYVCMYMYVCLYVCVCVCDVFYILYSVLVCKYVYVYVCMYVFMCVCVCVCDVFYILYSVLVYVCLCVCVCVCTRSLLLLAHPHTYATVIPTLHVYRFFSYAALYVGGKPLRSFHAVPQAKIPSSKRSWSNFSLVKKLSKNTWFFPLRMHVRSFTTLCPSASLHYPPFQYKFERYGSTHCGCLQVPVPKFSVHMMLCANIYMFIVSVHGACSGCMFVHVLGIYVHLCV